MPKFRRPNGGANLLPPEMSDLAGIAERLPWPRIAAPLATAEDALARLDERLRTSPIREGFIARTHFLDACASLWLEGELVHLEDLVLHDAEKDVRSPTHELTRAHAVLRARRRIASSEFDWALSASGLGGLRGRAGDGEDADPAKPLATKTEAIDADVGPDVIEDRYDPQLAEALTGVDAAMARADRAVAGVQARQRERDPLAYDPDWDEDARLEEWRQALGETRSLPATLAAAIALEAWSAIEPLQRQPWLGRLLVAALLRQRGKTSHLACLNVGLRLVPRERRRAREATPRLVATLEAIAAMAEAGLKDHDRWLTARSLLARKLERRRSTSSLPGSRHRTGRIARFPEQTVNNVSARDVVNSDQGYVD